MTVAAIKWNDILCGTIVNAEHVESWLNPGLQIEKRVDDLISRLTLDEKVRIIPWGNLAIPRLGNPCISLVE